MATALRINAATGAEEVVSVERPPLEQEKAALRASINALRDEKKAISPSPVGPVDSGVEARLNISGAVQMAQIAMAQGQPFIIDWTLADNSVAEGVDAVAMIGIGVAAGQHVAACHAVATALKHGVDAAEDYDTLDAIDINAGWPA